jgi:uridine phosphorylase
MLRYWLIAFLAFIPACAPHTTALPEYTLYNASNRQNLPADYIAYLKHSRFTHHELDGLPPYAILFHGNPIPYFAALHVSSEEITTLDLGTTDTSTLYIIRPHDGSTAFLINRAQPGAGGTATQTAELTALGARYLIHIGTSGLLGKRLDEHTVIQATSSYKDGGATLLSLHPSDRLSHPDDDLTRRLHRHLEALQIPSASATGYTIPIYYFQPAGLISALLAAQEFSRPRPEYIEMEEAPFFESAALTHTAAASLTVGSDRYTISGNGTLAHAFLDDAVVTQSLTAALRAARATFNDLAK